MRLSKSSISRSDRLRRKLKFHEKGRVDPRIKEIWIFLSVTTLNSLGYWEPKGWSPHHKSSQNQILSPSPTTNRVNLENSWKTCAIAFQGQRCDHLTIVLASHPLECNPQMLKLTLCHRAKPSLKKIPLQSLNFCSHWSRYLKQGKKVARHVGEAKLDKSYPTSKR